MNDAIYALISKFIEHLLCTGHSILDIKNTVVNRKESSLLSWSINISEKDMTTNIQYVSINWVSYMKIDNMCFIYIK